MRAGVLLSQPTLKKRRTLHSGHWAPMDERHEHMDDLSLLRQHQQQQQAWEPQYQSQYPPQQPPLSRHEQGHSQDADEYDHERAVRMEEMRRQAMGSKKAARSLHMQGHGMQGHRDHPHQGGRKDEALAAVDALLSLQSDKQDTASSASSSRWVRASRRGDTLRGGGGEWSIGRGTEEACADVSLVVLLPFLCAVSIRNASTAPSATASSRAENDSACRGIVDTEGGVAGHS